MNFRHVLSIAVLLGLCSPLSALASTISAVKGTQVVINMDTENYQAGQVVYGMTGTKRTALIQIQKIKGNKALGTITKGHAAVGSSTMLRTASNSGPSKQQASRGKNAQPDNEDSSNHSTIVRNRKKWSGGFLVGYAMQSAKMTIQTTTPPASESANFTGSAISLKGFADLDYTSQITLRFAFGLEPLSTKATTSNVLCSDNTNSCKFNYNFIALEGAVHYNLVTTPNRYWVGLGYAYLVDAGHSNNVPNVALSGGSSQMIIVSAGADFTFGRGFIPVALEYDLFPGGGGVTISSITFRGGYGFSF